VSETDLDRAVRQAKDALYELLENARDQGRPIDKEELDKTVDILIGAAVVKTLRTLDEGIKEGLRLD
jgi:hypothetical protein